MSLPTVIVYHVPAETPEVFEAFRPFVARFTESMRKFKPGCEYKLVAVISGAETPLIRAFFNTLPVFFVTYLEAGCDIGAYQHYAKNCDPCFQVNCVARVYAHREGWLKKLVDARRDNGPGLYGTSVAVEQGRLHCCTRCYAFDSEDFKKYPWNIDCREKGPFFEWGEGNLLNWFVSTSLCARVVYWTGSYLINDKGHWASPDNIFRKGDQSNMLVFDKHTDLYRDADAEGKKALAAQSFGANP